MRSDRPDCERDLLLLGFSQLLSQGLQELPGDHAVGLHEWTELPKGEPVADEICVGDDRRCPRTLIDQRDLTEIIALLKGRSLNAADEYGSFQPMLFQ